MTRAAMYMLALHRRKPANPNDFDWVAFIRNSFDRFAPAPADDLRKKVSAKVESLLRGYRTARGRERAALILMDRFKAAADREYRLKQAASMSGRMFT